MAGRSISPCLTRARRRRFPAPAPPPMPCPSPELPEEVCLAAVPLHQPNAGERRASACIHPPSSTTSRCRGSLHGSACVLPQAAMASLTRSSTSGHCSAANHPPSSPPAAPRPRSRASSSSTAGALPQPRHCTSRPRQLLLQIEAAGALPQPATSDRGRNNHCRGEVAACVAGGGEEACGAGEGGEEPPAMEGARAGRPVLFSAMDARHRCCERSSRHIFFCLVSLPSAKMTAKQQGATCQDCCSSRQLF